VVVHIRAAAGYANKADDLCSLAALFTGPRDRDEGECYVNLEGNAGAELVGVDMLRVMSPARKGVFDEMRSLR
jgi:hypothetical protein